MSRSRPFAGFAVLVAAGLAATAFIAVMLLAAVPVGPRPETHYWGARVLPPGPGVDGLPAIPVARMSDGSLVGVPSHLNWYAYSGRENAPGLRLDHTNNNTFYYSIRPERLLVSHKMNQTNWWEPLLGEPMRAEHFPASWTAAPALWRSPQAGDHGPTFLHAWVFRVDAGVYPEPFRSEFASDGFVAFTAQATHFGCEVSWAMTSNPIQFTNGKRMLLDSCHDSRYDPREVRRYELPAAESDLG